MCMRQLLIGLGLSTRTEQESSTTAAMTGAGDTSDGTQPNKFKVLGTLAIAVKRFQASVNPTIDFGRKGDSFTQGSTYQPPDARSVSAPPPKSVRGPMSSMSGSIYRRHQRTLTEGGATFRRSHSSRGHMTSYLFKPLADVRSEA
ncbi:hypothetical protein BSKO_00741 [Bryopsis sp. KO-2023]|nr:hypothetical protein BSKO_00741 [Bryopsis sp. KO-2023]